METDEPLSVPCGGYQTPGNLIGFNIYKDGTYLDYVHFFRPGSCFYIDPIDFSNQSFVEYEVTSLYDLTPYGFPGETEESPPDGPAEIFIPIYWLELNFLEDWSAGTFDDNAWYVTDSNWTVSQDIGNEAPCAVFMPDALMNNYEATLESYHFLELSTNEIILEYDVSFLRSILPAMKNCRCR